jgi:hypothetical protein
MSIKSKPLPVETDAGEPKRAYILGRHWQKSSYSMNGDCVEVALLGEDHVGVRDSKATVGSFLRFRPDVWAAFLAKTRNAHSPSGDLIL